MNNPYKQKAITEKSIRAAVNLGGCYCVRSFILKDIEQLKTTKAKKAKLWEIVDKTKWESC